MMSSTATGSGFENARETVELKTQDTKLTFTIYFLTWRVKSNVIFCFAKTHPEFKMVHGRISNRLT